MISMSIKALNELTVDSIIKVLIQMQHSFEYEEFCKSFEKYFRDIPCSIRSKLLDLIVSKKLSANYINLFFSEDRKHLQMPSDYATFNFSLFLDTCGFKMGRLRSLKLPSLKLLEPDCAQLSVVTTHLNVLEMTGGSVSRNAIKHLAKLPLTRLKLRGSSVTKDGILELCSPQSKAKETLISLEIAVPNSDLLFFILVSHPNLKQLQSCSSKICHNLSQEMCNRIIKCGIKLEALSLNLDSSELGILEMVTVYCQSIVVLKLHLENKVYSDSWIDRIFTLINKFVQLNTLHLHIAFINEFETSLNDISELVKLKTCLKQLTLRHLTICPSITPYDLEFLNFPFLTKLCIWEDREIARWALVAFLSSCPNVEYLNLRCRYFDDEVLFKVMDNGVMQKLKKIELDVPWENLMSYAGVKRLLCNPSIERCVIPSRYFLLFQRALIEMKKTSMVEIVDVCGS